MKKVFLSLFTHKPLNYRMVRVLGYVAFEADLGLLQLPQVRKPRSFPSGGSILSFGHVFDFQSASLGTRSRNTRRSLDTSPRGRTGHELWVRYYTNGSSWPWIKEECVLAHGRQNLVDVAAWSIEDSTEQGRNNFLSSVELSVSLKFLRSNKEVNISTSQLCV